MNLRILIKKIVGRLTLLADKDHINWCKTILANLMFVPSKDVFKFPILIYGPCKFGRVYGQIEFKQPIRKGLLKIGYSDPVRSRFSKSYISIAGKLEVEGSLILRRGISFIIWQNGIFTVGNNVSIGHNCSLKIRHNLKIGDGTSVGNNTTFMDTDIHYIINTLNKKVKYNYSSIEIGSNNWIGAWCTIKKGAKTPTGTIVAGPYSMISKDYTDKIPEYSVIAGSPAKLIASGMRRINNDDTERLLNKHFADTNKSEYIYNELSNLDSFCTPQ